MIYINFVEDFDFEYDIQGMVRSFYPGIELKSLRSDIECKNIASVKVGEEGSVHSEKAEFTLACCFTKTYMSIAIVREGIEVDKAEFCRIYDEEYDRKATKNELKRRLYDLLKKYTGKELVWGTLSGIRPTKITSEMLGNGMSEAEVYDTIKREYYISDVKAREIIEISKRELEILGEIDKGYSIYIGIPFCPSTCLYCSFTSNPVSRFRDKTDLYIDCVLKELKFCAETFKDKRLCTIYIGGGTPTTLEAEQLDRLLGGVAELFDTKNLYEYTIEAGRPDSITRDKLRVIHKYDITRISVNPQTMKEETLKVIGRHHTVEQFLCAYEMVREEGFDNVNMDFILGLPGEEISDVRNSMEWVKKLRPDSLTIHSLAVKRAARLNLEQRAGKKYDIHNSDEMMEITKETAQELGLVPYYLYRQKNMAGNLENVGYASRGREGIYNILIMEERQTILAVGAGSSTKMVHAGCKRIDRVENVKDVDLYMEKIDEMIERKRVYIKENYNSIFA